MSLVCSHPPVVKVLGCKKNRINRIDLLLDQHRVVQRETNLTRYIAAHADLKHSESYQTLEALLEVPVPNPPFPPPLSLVAGILLRIFVTECFVELLSGHRGPTPTRCSATLHSQMSVTHLEAHRSGVAGASTRRVTRVVAFEQS